MHDLGNWSLKRIQAKSVRKLFSFARRFRRIRGAIGYGLDRHVGRRWRRVSAVVRSTAAPVATVLAGPGAWLRKRVRASFRWLLRALRPMADLIEAIALAIDSWFERLFGKTVRRCAARIRPVFEPLQVASIAVGAWSEKRLRKLREVNLKKALWVTSVVMVALAGAGYWQGRPIYRSIREKRFLALAREFSRKGDDLKALICARNVLAYNAKNPDATELTADLYDRNQLPQALAWRRRVVELRPTFTNRIKLADCSLRYEAPPFSRATQTLEELSQAEKQTVNFHLASARLALHLGQLSQAESHFQAALELEPTHELHRLNLAVLRLRSTSVIVAASARAVLEGLRANASFGGEALRALLADRLDRKDFLAARRFADHLLSHPRGGFRDRLVHLSILHQTQSPDLAPALQSAQTAAATNALQAAELGGWMIARGHTEATLGWLLALPAAMRRQNPIPLTLALCYQAREDWRGLQNLLQQEDWGSQDYLRWAFLTRALREQGHDDVARTYWQQASRAACERPELAALLAQTARSWGWTNQTEELLATMRSRFAAQPLVLQYVFQQYHSLGNTQELFRAFSPAMNPQSTHTLGTEVEALLAGMTRRRGAEPWAMGVMQHLFQQQVVTGHTREIYQTLATLLQRGSDDIAIKNNLATAAMLLRTNLPLAHTLARQVYEREPKNGMFASTYAYSLHIQGKTAEALEVLQALDLAELEKPSVAAYYGCLLAAAGQTGEAKEYLALSDAAPLLPEEKELVMRARQLCALPGSTPTHEPVRRPPTQREPDGSYRAVPEGGAPFRFTASRRLRKEHGGFQE